MNTKEAVEHVMKEKGLTNYALCKSLDMSPTSGTQWVKGTRMSDKTAEKFTSIYGIEIDDAFSTSNRSS